MCVCVSERATVSVAAMLHIFCILAAARVFQVMLMRARGGGYEGRICLVFTPLSLQRHNAIKF